MSKLDLMEIEGVITNNFPGSKFEVTVKQENSGNEIKVICTLSGKIRKSHIKLVRGDNVIIRLSPYDLSKGIICWRM